jgi:FKBP-type peptidyl-prolyl cis-trans isomerase FkpA
LSNRILSLFVLCAIAVLPGCGGSDSTTGSSGGTLVIEDLVVGTGATAAAGNTISVHYIGSLTNGTVFANSYGGQPFNFVLGQGVVIPGWDQGVPGMKVGGKRRLTIPPSLAYGSTGYQNIPPNATLKFDIELLAILG